MDERTILVVEDDADINALLAKIAAREGFGCVQAYSGTEALRRWNARRSIWFCST